MSSMKKNVNQLGQVIFRYSVHHLSSDYNQVYQRNLAVSADTMNIADLYQKINTPLCNEKYIGQPITCIQTKHKHKLHSKFRIRLL